MMTLTRDAIPADGLPPIGTNGGEPLAEYPLPFWLPKPCPSWCRTPHKDCDSTMMRAHMSGHHSVMLSAETGGELRDDHDPSVQGWSPWSIDFEVHQGYREAEPYIHFLFACDGEHNATLDEAQALAGLIQDRIDHAGDMADGVSPQTPGKPFWLEACPAWCVARHEDKDHPHDRMHSSDYQSVVLSMEAAYDGAIHPAGSDNAPMWVPLDLHVALEQDWREIEARIVIEYGNDQSVSLTVDEACELAADIIQVVASAR
jgi:hypothetical protein